MAKVDKREHTGGAPQTEPSYLSAGERRGKGKALRDAASRQFAGGDPALAVALESCGVILRVRKAHDREEILPGKQARKTGMAGTRLDALTLSIPVSGDVSKPEFNLTYALVEAMAGQPEATDLLLKQASRAASSALNKWLDSRHRKKAAATNDTGQAADLTKHMLHRIAHPLADGRVGGA
jgi:hypothetical protein